MNAVRSNNVSLKYQRPTPSGCKDIGIRKFEFVAKTQFLCAFFLNNKNRHYFIFSGQHFFHFNHKSSLSHVSCYKIFELDRFSRFYVYWIQTNKDPNKPSLKIAVQGCFYYSPNSTYERKLNFVNIF